MMKLKKTLLLKSLQGLSFLVLITFSSCKNQEKKAATDEKFVMSAKMLDGLETADVTLKPVQNQLNFYGKISADNNKMIEVFPVVGGIVLKVYVELGDYVQKGQLLASIRSTEVASFEKDLDDAKNDLIVNKNNLKVAQELYEGKLNTERDLLEAKSNLDKANSQLLRVQETYRIYNIKKEAIYEVRSPLSGFIIQKNINQDMLLRSDKSDNIFDVAEITDVWAIANINESDIGQVKLGVDADVTTLSYPDKIFHGKVDKIYNIIDVETKSMQARIKLANPGFLLKPEMRATTKISFTEGKSMITVPSTAVIFDKNKSFVVVYKDKNNVESRAIEVYKQVGENTYIANGVAEGEKVLTKNQLLIYDALNN